MYAIHAGTDSTMLTPLPLHQNNLHVARQTAKFCTDTEESHKLAPTTDSMHPAISVKSGLLRRRGFDDRTVAAFVQSCRSALGTPKPRKSNGFRSQWALVQRLT